MKQTHSPFRPFGFTIVELLIVISVVGILTAVGIVGWSATTARSQDEARVTEITQWKEMFDLYKSRFGTYPAGVTDTYFCLGETGFPNNKCRAYTTTGSVTYNVSDNAALMNELKRVSPRLIERTHTPAGNHVGPFMKFEATRIRIFAVLSGANSCASLGLSDTGVSGSGYLYCEVRLNR